MNESWMQQINEHKPFQKVVMLLKAMTWIKKISESDHQVEEFFSYQKKKVEEFSNSR